MKFREYIDTAQRHLISCDAICKAIKWDECRSDEKNEILKDLFYLTGYILEALTVYTVYSRGRFNPEKDITELDINFTKKTHVDYYNTKFIYIENDKEKDDQNSTKDKECNTSDNTTKKTIRISISYRKEKKEKSFDENLKELNELIKETPIYSIQGHEFNIIIKKVLQNSKYGLLLPNENIPLFSPGNGANEQEKIMTKNIRILINHWSSKLRYSSSENQAVWNEIKDVLTKENIEFMIILCKIIKESVYKVG